MFHVKPYIKFLLSIVNNEDVPRGTLKKNNKKCFQNTI